MRVDKYLWCIRVFKTRSISAAACKSGKVQVGGEQVKASFEVRAGQEISIRKGPIHFKWQVLSIPKNRVGPKLVEEYAVDRTDPTELEKLKLLQAAQTETRRNKLGRPTKKDRRDLDKFFD